LLLRARSALAPLAPRIRHPSSSRALDRLEAAIRQLTGSMEQLQYRNQQLEQQVRRLQEGG
jgi:cell division protein FtsB